MSRVEIIYPEVTHFSAELAVRISDINYGNHLGHDGLITMIHEARILFFKSLGYQELDVEGIGTLIADLAISYKSESFYGDILKFDIAVQDITSKSCQFYYQITRMADESRPEQLTALAKTGIVFFDFDLRKAAKIPVNFINKLGS